MGRCKDALDAAGGNKTQAAKQLGMSRTQYRRALDLELASIGEKHVPDSRPDFKIDIKQDTAEIWALETPCRTWQDVAAKAGHYDPDIWEVVEQRAEHATWTTAMKLEFGSRRDGNYTQQPHLETNHGWRVYVKLRRRAPKPITDGLDAIHKRMEKWSPRRSFFKAPQSKVRRRPDPHMYVLSLVDHHFGKLCWEPETGSNYDLQIAEDLFFKAGMRLLDRVSGVHIEKFVLPLGHDFIHIDTVKNTTTSGTPQDVDGRYAKVIETAFTALIKLTDALSEVAPVEWHLVQGNHDRHAAYHLAREAAAWYRNSKWIDVDYTWTKFKSIEYGQTLIGMGHGDTEHRKKPQTLGMFMAKRWKEAFARTTHHEWHLGHHHTQRKREFLPMYEEDNVIIRTLPSLTGTDAYHYENMYFSRRAAEAYLYNYRYAFAGLHQVGIDECLAA